MLLQPSGNDADSHADSWDASFAAKQGHQGKVPDELFLHVGHINKQTWHFGVLLLERLDGVEPMEPDMCPRGLVHVVHEFGRFRKQNAVFSNMQLIAHFLDATFSWQVSYRYLALQDETWSLEYNGSLPTLPIPNVDSHVFWAGAEAEAKAKTEASKRKRKPRPQQQRGRQKKVAAQASRRRQLRELEEDDEEPHVALEDDLDDADEAVASLDALDLYAEEGESEDDAEAVSSNEDQHLVSEHASSGTPTEDDLDLGDASEDEAADSGEGPAAEAAAVRDQLEAIRVEPAAEAPPPLPAAAPAAGVRVQDRSAANRTVFLIPDVGELRYYSKTHQISAFCPFRKDRHANDCRKSASTNPAQGRVSGRPIGMLIAWLELASECDCKMTHVHACVPTLAQRQAARRRFQSLPGWEAFAANEKPRENDREPEEPIHV